MMLDHKELRHLEALLRSEQASLDAELERLRSLSAADEAQSEHAGTGNHMADDATDLFEQEKALSLQHNTENLLLKVDAALRKMENGSYGVCDSCGRAIDRARLETLPYATLCVTCKARQEKS